MPKIAVYKFLTFFIYAFDALNEPPHLHIVKEKGNRQRSAKIIDRSTGSDLRSIVRNGIIKNCWFDRII